MPTRFASTGTRLELGSHTFGFPSYHLLTTYVRQHCRAAGHTELEQVSRSKLHEILTQGELRPHKVRYYVERRDPEFEQKMAAVLHVYKEVEILNEGLLRGVIKDPDSVTVSYDVEARYSGSCADDAGSAAGARAACQPSSRLRIQTPGYGVVAGRFGSASRNSDGDGQRHA